MTRATLRRGGNRLAASLVGLVLAVAGGCRPAAEDLGEIRYEIPTVPGSEEPHPLGPPQDPPS